MTLTRRDFLKSGLAVAGLCYSWPQLSLLAAGAAQLQPRRPGTDKILVVVQLAGGNDGLNTVVPYGIGAYYQLRPAISIKQEQVLPLNGQLGLHPNMKALSDLHRQGKVAVLLGLGYPHPNRSHFRSIEIWQTANPEKIIDTGWLGRYLDLLQSGEDRTADNVFPAVNVDPILPKTLSAQKAVVPSVYDLNQFRFATDSHYQQDHKAQVDAFNKLYADFEGSGPEMDLVKKVGLDSLKASDYLFAAVKNYKGTVNYPDSGFARSLKFISQMICAGVSARVYNVTLNGFDTHSNQVNNQGRLLQQLSDGVAAFQHDLEAHNLDHDVILITFSEFGRRVAQNNGGTDHGTAAPHFVIGSSIKGGIYGDYPSLTDLDAGDLRYKMDFRNVYATVLDRWMGADSRQILGAHFDDLEFVKPA